MITQKKNRDSGSILRDKYMMEHLKEALKNSSNYPKLTDLKNLEYIIPKIKESVMIPILKREEYISRKQEPHKGVILYGVPGVGKTYLSYCIAKEMDIPIIKCQVATVKDIRESFRKAELLRPCLILIDNIDILFKNNKDDEINQILELIENMEKGMLAIATAKSLFGIDSRLRGFNRFEVEILIKVPGTKERLEILKFILNNCDYIDCDSISKNTPGFTPSDISKLVRSATTKSINKGQTRVSDEDFRESIMEIRNLSGITFEDIGALENVKEVLKFNIVLPSLYPEVFKKMGITKASGILLYGPPGCGKTMLAKAVSNMTHSNFISVRGPELISKYVGDSEKEIRELFDRAKALSPSVIFFDEIDSICSKRNSSSFGNRIVNQILTLLDGLEERGSVFIIAATNRLKSLDKALLRPGRFDKIVEVPYPSPEECQRIFKKLIENLPVENIDFKSLTFDKCSGADISGIVRDAAMISLKRDMNGNSFIKKEDFEFAIAQKNQK